MRLEVLIDSEEPIIYPLNKSKLVIGSSESADIIINVDGVSRKHLVLTTEGDQYSVTDQGSTNGTYINEERLVPGKKVEFTSFFPVRMGDRVLISLLSDDEDSPFSSLQEAIRKERTNPAFKKSTLEEGPESTKMINLKQLQQSQATKKLQDQRKKVIQDKKAGRPVGRNRTAPPSVDKQRMLVTQVLVATMVIGAIYFQFFYDQQSPLEIAPPVESVKVTQPVTPAPTEEMSLIAQADLLTKDSLNELIKGMKCATSTEKSLCRLFFPNGTGGLEGVIESPGFINIFFPEDSYYAEARSQMGITTPEAIQKSSYLPEHWLKMAYIIFITNKLMTIDPTQLPSKNINYIFISIENGIHVSGVMTIKPENFPKILQVLKPSALKTVKEYGLFTLDPILKYVQIY